MPIISIGGPHTHKSVPGTAFGLYYDEDEDGRYGPVGSLALIDDPITGIYASAGDAVWSKNGFWSLVFISKRMEC